MTYEDFYKRVASVVKTHYSEVGIANGVIAVLEQFRLDEEAAQQSVQRTACPECNTVQELVCPNLNCSRSRGG